MKAKNLLIVFGSGFIMLLMGELVLRILGFSPWNAAPDPISVIPGGSVFQLDPVTGFRHKPGKFQVQIGELTFEMTHNERSLRITSTADTVVEPEGPELWFLGGSFTHGWAVNDNETFPWLLQSRYPKLRIVNYGVGGYGTLLSLLQLERELESGNLPDAVIVFYVFFHDQRNVFSRERRKTITGLNHLGPLAQPKVSFNESGQIEQIDSNTVEYEGLPGIEFSAVLNLLDDAYNSLERMLLRERDVTAALFERMAALAKRYGFELFVAGLSPDKATVEMLQRVELLGISTIDMAMPFWEPEFNNMPWDSHPNTAGQEIYAQKLERELLRLGLID
ncbi:MAG: SGNH/GDSL hydrolase family protein [Gammaproteobacteria bacterium]|nr:SGNH/GDSL hydrolase family protein [Pseudomonadales bacterium]